MTNSLVSMIDRNIRVGQDTFTGRNIRHRRWMLGMTRENLGFRVGASEKEIEELESGDRHITTRELKEIAIALKVPMAALTNGFEPFAREADECLAATLSLKEAFGLLAQVFTTDATHVNASPGA